MPRRGQSQQSLPTAPGSRHCHLSFVGNVCCNGLARIVALSCATLSSPSIAGAVLSFTVPALASPAHSTRPTHLRRSLDPPSDHCHHRVTTDTTTYDSSRLHTTAACYIVAVCTNSLPHRGNFIHNNQRANLHDLRFPTKELDP